MVSRGLCLFSSSRDELEKVQNAQQNNQPVPEPESRGECELDSALCFLSPHLPPFYLAL